MVDKQTFFIPIPRRRGKTEKQKNMIVKMWPNPGQGMVGLSNGGNSGEACCNLAAFWEIVGSHGVEYCLVVLSLCYSLLYGICAVCGLFLGMLFIPPSS